MSVFDLDLSDFFFATSSDVQGNKFNGLEFSDVVTSGLFFDEFDFLTSFDFIDESFDLSESFSANHEPFCYLSESIGFSEEYPLYSSVALSVVNYATPLRVSPVKVYWIGLDILHGPDCFFEECIDTLYAFSSATIANLFFDTLYDDYLVDLYPPDSTGIDVARIVFLQTGDLLVSTDTSVQEYYFNNICDERFFVFPLAIRGFPCMVSDRLGLRDPVLFAHTRSIDEALALIGACGTAWEGQETLSEAFTTYDESLLEKYYDHLLSESIAFVMANDAYSEISALADEAALFVDSQSSFSAQYQILMESLIASEVSSLVFACFEDASDAFSVDHDTLCRQLLVDIVHDTCEALAASDFQIGVFEKVLESLVSYEVIEEQHERV